MMRSLFSGVAGLKTHQTRMDVIGNNIANVNTTAYKSQSMTFQDLLYQTTQNASAANANTGAGGTNARQIGLGAKTGAISTAITQQGSAQSTNNPFDIMITGDSFFVVSNGSDNFFTRDGSFCVDGVGNLVMSSTGYTVMGWQYSEAEGSIIQDKVSPLRIMSAENMTYPPAVTTEAYLSGIVDKNDINVTSDAGKVVGLSFYDRLGYQYNARFSIHEIDGDKGEFYVQLDRILDSEGKVVTGVDEKFGGNVSYEKTGSLSKLYDGHKVEKQADDTYKLVDSEGNEVTGDEAIAAAFGLKTAEDRAKYDSLSFDSASGQLITTKNVSVDNAAYLQYDKDKGTFKGIGTTRGAMDEDDATMSLTFDLVKGGNFMSDDPTREWEGLKIDFSRTTMYNNNGTSTVSATNGNVEGRNTGRRLGELSGVSISKDGTITGTYDNGQSKTLGQIAVAAFANAAGLEKAGDNLYSSTPNSGEFDGIGIDITGNGDYMTSGVLEMSNVDLAGEFTTMITTQRGFQANSRIITVSDSLLEELTNLKR